MKNFIRNSLICSSLTVLTVLTGCSVTSVRQEESTTTVDGCTGFAVSVSDFRINYRTLSTDQWESIFESFVTDGLKGEKLFDEKLQYLISHPRHMATILKNAEPYIYSIYREVMKVGLPAEIVIVPMIESMYQTNARSPSGYVGMWQFGAQTARNFGLKVNKKVDERTDFRKSSASAIGYLAYLNKFFDNNWQLAVAGYNAGEGRIQKAIKKSDKSYEGIDFRTVDMPVHTRNYLYSIYAYAHYLKNYKQYKVALPNAASSWEDDNIGNLSRIVYVTREEFVAANNLSREELDKMDLVVRRRHKGKETLCQISSWDGVDGSQGELNKAYEVSSLGVFSNLEKQVVSVVKDVDPVKLHRIKPQGVRGKTLEKYVVKESIYDEDAYFKALQRMIEEDLSAI